MTRLAAALLTALVLAGTALATPAGDHAAALRAARWLAPRAGADGRGDSADAAAALRSVGLLTARDAARRAAALRRAARGYDATPGATAKTILGLVALGAHRPQCAGAFDLRRHLHGFYRRGRYSGEVFDQALPMLALRALGARPPRAAVRVLRGMRGRGGWGYSPSQADDPSSTALAILALRAGGVSPRDGAIHRAIGWLAHQRARGGGFAMGRRDRTEANSTALVIEALHELHRRSTRDVAALLRLQRRDGSFGFTRASAGSTVIATNDAVVALAGRAIPVGRRSGAPRGRCS